MCQQVNAHTHTHTHTHTHAHTRTRTKNSILQLFIVCQDARGMLRNIVRMPPSISRPPILLNDTFPYTKRISLQININGKNSVMRTCRQISSIRICAASLTTSILQLPSETTCNVQTERMERICHYRPHGQNITFPASYTSTGGKSYFFVYRKKMIFFGVSRRRGKAINATSVREGNCVLTPQRTHAVHVQIKASDTKIATLAVVVLVIDENVPKILDMQETRR